MKVVIFPFFIFSQDLEKVVKLDKNSVKVSGGLNYSSTVFLTDNPLSKTRPPFAWYASGNINISAFGMAFPFTYAISNQNKSFSQPSNITALHPTYKWVKTHIGRISMSFSPYTLSGINFSGAGIELTPNNFKFSAMYGKISKPVEYIEGLNSLNSIVYERWGAGFMFGYNLKGVDLTMISFKAFDDPNSLKSTYGQSLVKPKDNLVTSFKVRTSIIKNLTFESEYASSLVTNNVRIEEQTQSNKWYVFMYPMVRGNATTDAYDAFKGSLNYTIKSSKLGFSYERIDPNYQTLGGLFFQNDMENFTFTPSFSFFKNALSVALNTGLQRNNLSNVKSSQTERWIGSVNVNYRILKNLSSSFSYSNFSSFTRNNPNNDPFALTPVNLDTANIYQINESFNSNFNFSFGKDKNTKGLMTTFAYSVSNNITGKLENAGVFGINASGSTSTFKSYLNTFGYNQKFDSQNLSLSFNGNSNLSTSSIARIWFVGPSINVSKSLGKDKPSLSGGITYNRNYQNKVLTNNVYNFRLNFSHNPKLISDKYGKFTLSANSMFLYKLPTDQDKSKIHELTFMINLSYNFK